MTRLCLLAVFICGNATAEPAPTASATSIPALCSQSLRSLPAKLPADAPIDSVCSAALQAQGCSSVKQKPIFHWEKKAEKEGGKRVLVFGLIHGDEPESGDLVRHWIFRLNHLTDNRNAWRIVPILNPDGFEAKTRTNANGIDLNRNFPTTDWSEGAVAAWKKAGSHPRRFPGQQGGSEPETQCAVNHIADFKPDLIVSVHTPYSLIDFDGPKKADSRLPRVRRHPVKRLGNFPGSLGRYMWVDRNIPVLTVELGPGPNPITQAENEFLQDSIGSLVVKDLGTADPKPQAQATAAVAPAKPTAQ